MTEKAQLRKQENILMVTGGGAIALALWSLIKSMMLMMNTLGYRETMGDAAGTGIGLVVYIIVLSLVFLLLFMEIRIRLYVGRSARAEAAGAKKGNLYLIIAGVYASMSLAGLVGVTLVTAGFHGWRNEESILENAATYLMEITSFFTMVQLIVAASKVRRLREAENAD